MLKPDKALELLMEGNNRFAQNKQLNNNQCIERRSQIKERQNPFAVIFSCSDSRVPPELIYDQGLGDLFVVRNAGHVLTDGALGSMEYAVSKLNVKLIVVMGHDNCGAIKTAINPEYSAESEHIQSIVDYIKKSQVQLNDNNDKIYKTTIANSVATVENIINVSSIIAKKVKDNKLKVVAANYNFDTGLVSFI